MNLFRRLLSSCAFGHGEPLKIMRDGQLHFECSQCQADLGVVLAGQKYRARRVRVKKLKSAKVLRIAKQRVR